MIISITQTVPRMSAFLISFEKRTVDFIEYILPRAKTPTRAAAVAVLKLKYSIEVGRTL